MKKVALTSLLAVFVASGANAANVIDGNPLYMPKAGHLYSVTSLDTSTKNVDVVQVGEKMGLGFTDRWSVELGTSVTEDDWFDMLQWNEISLASVVRVADNSHWKWDLMGGYSVEPALSSGGHRFLHGSFFGIDETEYKWNYGIRGGYTTGDFTIAGHIMMDYVDTESFNFLHKGQHLLRSGVQTQFVLSDDWNFTADAEYFKSLNQYSDKLGAWTITFGANYNFSEASYLGVYLAKDILHKPAVNKANGEVQDGTWEFQNGFGIGLKLGFDF
jgi:hypothetical protein